MNFSESHYRNPALVEAMRNVKMDEIISHANNEYLFVWLNFYCALCFQVAKFVCIEFNLKMKLR